METHNDQLHQGANPILYEYAKNLRHAPTEAENRLWEYLRGQKLNGLKFRRQHALKIYIADFYCNEKKIVLEVDGEVHENDQVKENDEARSNYLNEIGITVIRFTNDEVMNDIKTVLQRIRETPNKKVII